MADNKDKQTEQVPEQETPIKEVMPINEYMARKLEMLAQRVRLCQVVGFDLLWNLGKHTEDPTKLFGIMLTQASQMDDFLDPDTDSEEETIEGIQREIEAALHTPAIVVEDRTTPDVIVGVVPECDDDQDDEDFHIIDGDPDSDED